MAKPRLQKITNRPIRPSAARVGKENAGVQEEIQREYYLDKQKQFQALEQRMLKKIYGTQEEKE